MTIDYRSKWESVYLVPWAQGDQKKNITSIIIQRSAHKSPLLFFSILPLLLEVLSLSSLNPILEGQFVNKYVKGSNHIKMKRDKTKIFRCKNRWSYLSWIKGDVHCCSGIVKISWLRWKRWKPWICGWRYTSRILHNPSECQYQSSKTIETDKF